MLEYTLCGSNHKKLRGCFSLATSIKDIAAAAEVSIATVSYVINGTRKVAPETAIRVQEAMEKLNYIPNIMARNLRTNNTKSIAIIIQSLSHGYFNDVLDSIYDVLLPHGYTMLLCITQNSIEEEIKAFKSMVTHQVSGIIMAPIQSDFNFKDLCPQPDFPLVFIDRTQKATVADSVICNNYDITYQAVTELIKQGHSRIAYLYGNQIRPLSTNVDRMNAYRSALVDNGFPISDELILGHDVGFDESYRTMEKVIRETNATATFIANGGITVPALHCLRDMNVAIPEQMSIVSFDEYSWSDLLAVPISTIRQPATELGSNAARLILERIKNPNKAHETVVLQSDLTIRV